MTYVLSSLFFSFYSYQCYHTDLIQITATKIINYSIFFRIIRYIWIHTFMIYNLLCGFQGIIKHFSFKFFVIVSIYIFCSIHTFVNLFDYIYFVYCITIIKYSRIFTGIRCRDTTTETRRQFISRCFTYIFTIPYSFS